MTEAFHTVSMAEILLMQDLLEEAEAVIAELEKAHPNDARITALRRRLESRSAAPQDAQREETPTGRDRVEVTPLGDAVRIAWEFTEHSQRVAQRVVRYSGVSVLRVFSAVPGPRGVRTVVRDVPLSTPCGSLVRTGLSPGAQVAAAVGFLGHNGHFVPMAHGRQP